MDKWLNTYVYEESFFTMAPDNRFHHLAIVLCLKHFGWNWVGILTPVDDSAEAEVRELTRLMYTHGICIEFIVKIANDQMTNFNNHQIINRAKAEVIIICGQFTTIYRKLLHLFDQKKTLILNDSWFIHPLMGIHYAKLVNSLQLNPCLAFKLNWLSSSTDRAPSGADIFCSRALKRKKPLSRCNEPCSPGSRKAPNGGYHICCYNCVPCSEGEMSNITDSETCQMCPMDQWPNREKTRCLPKLQEFLSYKEDKMASFFCFLVILCCAITGFTLKKFILYWDTPLVKANNRTLSFIILVSLLLSFLCVFFFLGRPLDITCMLRQTLFGISFSLAISSLIAKSMMVCIAFKATKPSSSWKKWNVVTLSNLIVVICSSVQVLICVSWLSTYPPYQDIDIITYPGKIIIQCNEGSDIWFYSMLGYLGFLAAVSFLLAFMVRTLPDSYNEAKYITFSMLVFCSVWIAMIPAYLSTRGKYMVAVEIFAILTSCAGILSCIFFPKLYILLVKPYIYNRKHFISWVRK
ncbi:vomeronasal type-2 receptor 26-like [Dendropsophus ebraccatus]|uniref:vomeronasal type-2 receptor 26-like n=1 Tax=Dendropsophus ebraccatus TaxID=150705 RepID=UPI003831F87E